MKNLINKLSRLANNKHKSYDEKDNFDILIIKLYGVVILLGLFYAYLTFK